jgi:hypothetical protein
MEHSLPLGRNKLRARWGFAIDRGFELSIIPSRGRECCSETDNFRAYVCLSGQSDKADSRPRAGEDLVNMLTAVLERSFLIVQLLLKIRDVLLETTRLG